MAPSSRRPDLVGRVGLGLLLAAVVVLGVRAHGTSRLTLAQGWNAGPRPETSQPSRTPISLTSSAQSGSSIPSRDPFRYLASSKPRSERSEAVDDKSEPAPVLGALLYDTVNPQVQLRVAGDASGWIGAGAVFKGWVVVAIEPDAVTVQKQGEKVVLR